MKTPLKWMLCCTSLCLAASALAQTDSGQSSSSSSQPSSSSSQSSSTMQQTSQGQQFYHAKDLIGTEAKGANGERLGKIEDVAFNPQNGQTFAAIGVGSGRYALVPWQALTINEVSQGKYQASLNTTKDQLQSAPTVTKNDWQKLNDPSFAQSVYSHFNLQPPAAMGGTSGGSMGGSSGTSGAGSSSSQGSTTGQP